MRTGWLACATAAFKQLWVVTLGSGKPESCEKYAHTFGEPYSASRQFAVGALGYQKRTISSRFVPFSRKGSLRETSSRRSESVPTLWVPVGAGEDTDCAAPASARAVIAQAITRQG